MLTSCHPQPHMAATILAAGQGRRMGYRPKANIHIEGLAILEWQVAALRGAGISDITVVVGSYLDQLGPLVTRCGAHMVVNESASLDFVTSQRTAIHAHSDRSPGTDMMLLLGDLPLLRSHHVVHLMDAWLRRGDGDQALVPMVDGVRGHPVLLAWKAIQHVEKDSNAAGIRAWMSQNKESVLYMPSDDPAYVQDLDTPSEIGVVTNLLSAQRTKAGA